LSIGKRNPRRKGNDFRSNRKKAFILGTSYIVPVKRENEKYLSFIKTVSYKNPMILGTLFPLNPMPDLP
jgi:hypothetical protein